MIYQCCHFSNRPIAWANGVWLSEFKSTPTFWYYNQFIIQLIYTVVQR